ncbi:MAG: hypothetical protein LAT64_05420 [Phycisphaerales bacterium]|nr:hypothetical protein [Planctomycetota bacterium]MCH8508195.1 hypothetical protein [Phycisphaerales bacterium]
MDIRVVARTAALWAAWCLVCVGGCAAQQTADPGEEDVGDKERITLNELDSLTRAFVDRFVGELYSVCDGLRTESEDPAVRREAQMLLVDSANNAYDIASNADAFTRVLDLAVIVTLMRRVWDDDGKAKAVFGDRGERLVEALARSDAEARALASRVLDDAQMRTLDMLVDDWRDENPGLERASFVRFSNFAIGRNRSVAEDVLAGGGLFFQDIAEARQAVDEVRLLGERMFYRLKREPTLLRWQTLAAKEDTLATPGVQQALADVGGLVGQLEAIPKMISEEREAIFSGLEERSPEINETIEHVRTTIEEANALSQSLGHAGESIRAMFESGEAFLGRLESQDGEQAGDFDAGEVERAANEVGRAANEVTEMLAQTQQLLGSLEFRHGVRELNESVDGRVAAAGAESRAVLNAFFWRAAALLVVFFVLLILYRLVSVLLVGRLAVRQAETRPMAGSEAAARAPSVIEAKPLEPLTSTGKGR